MTRGERDLRAQPVAAGTLQFIKRPGLCHGQQAERGVKRASAVLGLRRGHRPLRAARRVERQPGGPLKEHGRRRQTTAALCPPGALLKFGGNFLIGARRGLGPVPGSPLGISLRVGGLGQRAVQLLPRLDRGRPVGRRAHQRVPEQHPRAELGQSRLARRPRRPCTDREPPGRPPHQDRIPGWIGRRQLHQPPGLRWQRLKLPREALLDPSVERCRAAHPEPAHQLRRRQPAGQLKQRQRVPVRFCYDPVSDPFV